MARMTDTERATWYRGPIGPQRTISAAVVAGEYQCDDCGEPSAAIGHSGPGTVTVRCPSCFLAAMDGMRRNRPSRDALMAAVTA